jgi:transposase
LLASKERGRTFRRNEIARTRFASAGICIARNLIEGFFNKIKQCRRVATRYDKLAANYLAFVKLASIRIWLRRDESNALVQPRMIEYHSNIQMITVAF